jgi:hypothetical protein
MLPATEELLVPIELTPRQYTLNAEPRTYTHDSHERAYILDVPPRLRP